MFDDEFLPNPYLPKEPASEPAEDQETEVDETEVDEAEPSPSAADQTVVYGPIEPASPERGSVREQPPARRSGILLPFSIVFAAILISFSLWTSSGSIPTPSPADGWSDNEPAGSLKECVLLAIADGAIVESDPDYAYTIQDDVFWENAQSQFKEVEVLDDDDPLAKEFMSKHGVDPPLVAVIKPNKQPAWVMPLPKGGTDPIRERIDATK